LAWVVAASALPVTISATIPPIHVVENMYHGGRRTGDQARETRVPTCVAGSQISPPWASTRLALKLGTGFRDLREGLQLVS
jgi:hypothetical protein